MNLTGMSSQQLLALAERAKTLAAHLKASEPSYQLALEAGVRDRSYNTVRWGRVGSFEGTAIIHLEDGSSWQAVGHGPSGNAEFIGRSGWIEFIPIDSDSE